MNISAADLLILGVGLLVCALFLVYARHQRQRLRRELFQTQPNTITKGSFLSKTDNTVLLVADLEVVRTPKAIEQGLMNRTHLAPNTGMLFWFEGEAERSFWMRNTLVPLDIVFVNSAGRITNIHYNVPTENDTLRRSTEPVQYAVELPGGTAEKHGIAAGDRFVWTY